MKRIKTFESFQKINEEEGKLANLVTAIAISLSSLNLFASDELNPKTPFDNISHKGSKTAENIENIKEELIKDIKMLNSLPTDDSDIKEAIQLINKNKKFLDEYFTVNITSFSDYDESRIDRDSLVNNLKSIIDVTNRLIKKSKDPKLSKNVEDQSIDDLKQDVFYLKDQLGGIGNEGKILFYSGKIMIWICLSICLTIIVWLTTLLLGPSFTGLIGDIFGNKEDGYRYNRNNNYIEQEYTRDYDRPQPTNNRSVEEINRRVAEVFNRLREREYDFEVERSLGVSNRYTKSATNILVRLDKLSKKLPTFSSLIKGSIYLYSYRNNDILYPKIVERHQDGYGNNDLKSDFPNIKFDIFSENVEDDIVNFIDTLDDRIYQKYGS
jgi:hypothetical protein